MNRTLGMLAALLAAQLVLAVAMSFSGPDLSAHRPDTPLVDLGKEQVDRIVMQGPDRQELVLAQQNGHWVLPGSGGFPADGARVTRLLDALKGLKRGFAVATSEAAQTRFKVSDADFERRVKLQQGDRTLATLYFGSSPGLRQVQARSGGDQAVYTAAFGLYELPLKASDWEDKSILHLSAKDIDRIDLSGLTLSRVEGGSPTRPGQAAAADDKRAPAAGAALTGWRARELGDSEALSQPGASKLVERIAGLDIGSVLGTDDRPDYGLQAPALVLSVETANAKPVEYRLGKRAQQHDYVLKVSTRPEYFRLPAFVGDELVKAAARQQLVLANTGDSKTATADKPAAANPVASAPANAAAAPRPHAAEGGKL